MTAFSMLLLTRVAKTKTPESAWELVSRLTTACPVNEFVVLIEKPNTSPIVHAVGAFHKIDQERAQQVVKEFLEEKLSESATFQMELRPR